MLLEKLMGRCHIIKGSETYFTAEGKKVKLYYREYQPRGTDIEEQPGQNTGIFLYTAWATPTWANKELCQELADVSGVKTTVVKISGDPRTIKQVEGAEATMLFMEKKGYTNVTLLGNSQSGRRAAESVPLLRKNNPDIYLNGVIELGSMSMSDQNEQFISNVFSPSGSEEIHEGKNKAEKPGYVSKRRWLDRLLKDPGSHFFDRFFSDPSAKILWHPWKNRKILLKALKKYSSMVLDFIKQVIHAHGNILGGVENQRGEMITKSPAFKEIDVSVVLINGEADLMSPPNGIIPMQIGVEGARAHIRKLSEYQQKVKNNLFKENEYNFMLDPVYMDPANDNLKGVIAGREEYVHNTLLPANEGNRLIIADAKKEGHHALAEFRSKTVARTALAALERLNRRRRVFQSKEEFAIYVKDRRKFTQPYPFYSVKKAV